MGCDVVEFQSSFCFEKYENYLLWKIIKKLNRRLPLNVHMRNHNQMLLEFVEKTKPQIAIILKGLYVTSDVVSKLNRLNVWVVNLNHDDFFSRDLNNVSSVQRKAISHYDHIFTSRKINVDEVKVLNPNVSFLPFSFYPKIHRIPKWNRTDFEKWKSDVVFVGTWMRDRWEKLEKLVQSVPADYAIYGPRWWKIPKSSILTRHIRGGELGPGDMAKAIYYSKIALGFLSKENRDEYTTRTFEIPACGGLFLGERTPTHLKIYREGKEAEFFGSEDELIKKVKNLLTEDKARENIRISGIRAVTRGKFTHGDRIKVILEKYKKISRKQ
jgi:spore maturation protein CgeB